MSKIRVHNFSVSIDGFAAGQSQSLDNPLGIDGMALHEWILDKNTSQHFSGNNNDRIKIDEDFETRGFSNIGAWIIGRNMFGPIRGPWADDKWKGWWGDNPSFHSPVFILTNHARPSITMDGGTTFHFITNGIHNALERAIEASNGKDIRIGGGVSTLHQYLKAGLIDEIHLAITPVLLGAGEHLFAGSDLRKLGYQCIERINSDKVMHVVMSK